MSEVLKVGDKALLEGMRERLHSIYRESKRLFAPATVAREQITQPLEEEIALLDKVIAASQTAEVERPHGSLVPPVMQTNVGDYCVICQKIRLVPGVNYAINREAVCMCTGQQHAKEAQGD